METLNQAFPTIVTSGSILTCAGFIIGQFTSNATIASLGTTLGRGTLISIILVMTVLPQILLIGDWLIDKTAFTITREEEAKKRREASGRIHVNGFVKCYVSGQFERHMTGILDGEMNVKNRGASEARGEEEQNHAAVSKATCRVRAGVGRSVLPVCSAEGLRGRRTANDRD